MWRFNPDLIKITYLEDVITIDIYISGLLCGTEAVLIFWIDFLDLALIIHC